MIEQIQNLLTSGYEYIDLDSDDIDLEQDLDPLFDELKTRLNRINPYPNSKVMWVGVKAMMTKAGKEFHGFGIVIFDKYLGEDVIDTREKFKKCFGPNCFDCQDIVKNFEDGILTKLRTVLRNKSRAKTCLREAFDIVNNEFYASGDTRELEPIQEDVEGLEQLLEGLEENISWIQNWIVPLETIRTICSNF